MTHSKAPWTVQQLETNHNGYQWPTYAVRSQPNHCLATVGDVDRATAEENEANALLMAAAPAMYEALQSAKEFLDIFEEVSEAAFGRWDERRRLIIAALKLAEGEAIEPRWKGGR